MAAGTTAGCYTPPGWKGSGLLAWHPEWWTLAISAGAWLIIALPPSDSLAPLICSSASTGPIEGSISRLRAQPFLSEFESQYIGWLLMTTAMMLPLTALQVRHVAFRSFSWRRNRGITGFLIGYLVAWAVTGAAIVPALIAVRALNASGRPFILTFGFVLAAAWQLTPLKRRALRRCHRTVPLSPTGWRADASCVRFGAGIGGDCVLSCWALMLAMALASHSVLTMTCFQAIALHERYRTGPSVKAPTPMLLTGAAMLLSLAYAIGLAAHSP